MNLRLIGVEHDDDDEDGDVMVMIMSLEAPVLPPKCPHGVFIFFFAEMTLLFPLRAFGPVVDYLTAETTTTKKKTVLLAVDDAMVAKRKRRRDL